MSDNNNPLLCNPETGICEIPLSANDSNGIVSIADSMKPVKIIYFTDPICSSCWGIEPQLRKLKLEYGNTVSIEYRMGGLLPDWSYNSGGISKPSDVAHHWDEVSHYYDMPIDGDVWLQDPLHSSYPPSIAFIAAQLQSKEKALLFMRKIREMVFLEKKNITKWEHLEKAANAVGLDIAQFKTDYEGKANALFQQDLNMARSMGVRGFPTLICSDSSGKTEIIYGSKPYAVFTNTILKLHPAAIKTVYNKDWASVFAKYPSLTAREFAELTDTPRSESETTLQKLTDSGYLEKLETKNGGLWRLKTAMK